jgi:hypothetical protein
MRFNRLLCFSLALGGVLLLAPGAEAVTVTYTTVGTFDSGDAPGTSTYSDGAGGITIAFLSTLAETVDVPPPSLVTFGTFDTTGTTAAAFTGVASGFTLDIFQTSPSFGTATFVGSLTGQLRMNNSQAFVQFDAPLTGTIGLVVYSIVSADGGVPGRVAISPPTANDGESTIAGQVALIPEPSAILLMGLGAPVPLLLALRGRRKAKAAA